MFDIRGLARLLLTTSHNNNQIKLLTGRSATTVGRYRTLIQEQRITLAQLDAADDSELETLFRAGRVRQRRARPQPDWGQVLLQLKAGRTLQEVHARYAAETGDSAMSYRAFCRAHKERAAASHPVMIQRHVPGQAMMVDFAGYRPPGRRSDGQETRVELFVAVLPASDYLFACVVPSQKLGDWLEANERALRFFGGVPQTIVCDNLKAGVQKARSRGRPAVINPTFHAFCDHHGTLARPTAPRSPTHKSRVELGVKHVQRLLRLALKERPLMERFALDALLLDIVRTLNERPLRRANGESRISLFQALDQPALRPLRQEAFDYREVRRGLRLGQDYHVMHDGSRYSAPHTLIGRRLDLRTSTSSIEIWHDARMVALHPRAQPGEDRTDPAHMPPNHLARRADVEEDFLLWSRLHGPAVQAVAEEEARQPFHGAAKRSVYKGFRDLHRQVGSARMEAACSRAVRVSRPRLEHVRNILNSGLEFSDPADLALPDITVGTNENVRGADYYTGA